MRGSELVVSGTILDPRVDMSGCSGGRFCYALQACLISQRRFLSATSASGASDEYALSMALPAQPEQLRVAKHVRIVTHIHHAGMTFSMTR